MNARRIMIILTAVALVAAIVLGISSTRGISASSAGLPDSNKVALENVRAYAAAASSEGMNYAIDGGLLYAGKPLDWARVPLPSGVIANAVAVDASDPSAVYVGAVNELAVYRTNDGGTTWIYAPLTGELVGGVTDLAFDARNRMLYVATDSAGVFRMRDIGTSLTAGGHYMVHQPVLEVAADSTGAGLVFFRTSTELYRGDNLGINWTKVDSLFSSPTAVVVADSTPAAVYVGTRDMGVLKSEDGVAWMTANDGLNFAPGSRLHVDALAIDPVQPDVLYVASSFLYGSTTLHVASNGVAMSANGANEWAPVVRSMDTTVSELLPVAGSTGAVYTLSNLSRAPLALGVAPVAPVLASAQTGNGGLLANSGALVMWLVALAAGAWLGVLGAAELRSRPVQNQRSAQAIRINQ